MNKEEIDNMYKVLEEQWGDTDNYINDLLIYSKDLQQENKRLKEIEKEHQRINGELRETISKAINRINKGIFIIPKDTNELLDILKEVG